jgi:hypothetical protein
MSSVFDPGKKDRDRARAAGEKGIIKGGSFSGPGGMSGSFDFSGGKGTSNFNLGSFQNQLDMFQQMSAQGGQQAQGGLPPELRALGENTIGQLGGEFNRLGNEQNFNALGDVFNQSSATAGADPFELGAGVSEKLRALSERRNSRRVNSMFDRLKASGKLGTSGGAGIAAELDANIFDEGLKFDLAGLEAGRGLQSDAISRMFGSAGLREQIGGRQFGEDLGQNQFNNQTALSQFGVGSDMFRQFMANQAQGAQLATLGASGAQGIAQMPLAFQQAMMAGNAQASNSQFAQAGIHQNNASMAQSPVMNALTTAGSLAGSLGGAGLLGSGIAKNAGIAAGGAS